MMAQGVNTGVGAEVASCENECSSEFGLRRRVFVECTMGHESG